MCVEYGTSLVIVSLAAQLCLAFFARVHRSNRTGSTQYHWQSDCMCGPPSPATGIAAKLHVSTGRRHARAGAHLTGPQSISLSRFGSAQGGAALAVQTSWPGRPTSMRAAKVAGGSGGGEYRGLYADACGDSFRSVAKVRRMKLPRVEDLGPGQLLVQVWFAGVNGGCETFRVRGEHAFASNRSAEDGFALGAEGAGVVMGVGDAGAGDVNPIAVGDHVAFVGGAFAEYVVVGARTAWKIPKATPEAVALRISALTAFAMIGETGNVQKGETVLVTAAAGGAGHFAVQAAKMRGATVIGTCSTSEKADRLRSLGCDHVIVHTIQDVAKSLSELCPYGVDVVFEGVGGDILQTALNALKSNGRLLQVGYISEYPHNSQQARSTASAAHGLDADQLFWKRQTVQLGDKMIYGNAWPDMGTNLAALGPELIAMHSKGQLEAVIDARQFHGIEDVTMAVEHMLSGESMGKVVVEMR